MKAWHWILIAAAAVLLYLLVSQRTTSKLRSGTTDKSGLGGTLAGAGAAAEGLSDLWDSIAKTFGGKSDDDEEES